MKKLTLLSFILGTSFLARADYWFCKPSSCSVINVAPVPCFNHQGDPGCNGCVTNTWVRLDQFQGCARMAPVTDAPCSWASFHWAAYDGTGLYYETPNLPV